MSQSTPTAPNELDVGKNGRITCADLHGVALRPAFR